MADTDPMTAAAHQADYKAERRMREAIRPLRELLRNDAGKLSPNDRETLTAAVSLLQKRADHIVAVWD